MVDRGAPVNDDARFLTSVVEAMRDRGVTQSALANATGLSQPHLSKVLLKRYKLAEKTRRKLRAWVEGDLDASHDDAVGTLRSIGVNLERLPPSETMELRGILKQLDVMLQRIAGRRGDR